MLVAVESRQTQKSVQPATHLRALPRRIDDAKHRCGDQTARTTYYQPLGASRLVGTTVARARRLEADDENEGRRLVVSSNVA